MENMELIHEKWMKKALKYAQRAANLGEVPIGALIVKDEEVISYSYNKKESLHSSLGHAELMAIHLASKKLNNWRLTDCTLYVTLEPCLMCAGALWQSRISNVIFGAYDPKGGGLGSLYSFQSDDRLNHSFEVKGGVLERECAHLLTNFFKNRREENRARKLSRK
jgi:tRNA(adenine34) deaminase